MMTFPEDQSPEEATCKTDDTSSPRLSGSIRPYNPVYLSPHSTHTPTPRCFSTYVTQSPTSANPQDPFIYPLEFMFVIGKIPLEDDQILLWKLPSPSCLLNPDCAPRHCFPGTPPNGGLWCFHKPPTQSGVRQVFLFFIASSRTLLLHPSSKFLTPLKHTLFIYYPSGTVTHQLSCHLTGMLPFTAPVIVLSQLIAHIDDSYDTHLLTSLNSSLPMKRGVPPNFTHVLDFVIPKNCTTFPLWDHHSLTPAPLLQSYLNPIINFYALASLSFFLCLKHLLTFSCTLYTYYPA